MSTLEERQRVRRTRDHRAAGILPCSQCGFVFSVTGRQLRAINAGKRSQRCERCIEGEQIVVDAQARDFWRSRFQPHELVAIAEFSWGPVAEWGDEWRAGFVFLPDTGDLALAASASPAA